MLSQWWLTSDDKINWRQIDIWSLKSLAGSMPFTPWNNCTFLLRNGSVSRLSLLESSSAVCKSSDPRIVPAAPATLIILFEVSIPPGRSSDDPYESALPARCCRVVILYRVGACRTYPPENNRFLPRKSTCIFCMLQHRWACLIYMFLHRWFW